MKRMLTVAVLLMLSPLMANAHLTLKDWTSGEVLTSEQLDTEFGKVDDGLDEMLELEDFADSLNTRLPDEIPLFWIGAWGDSTATNDSLTVTITNDSPLGDGQSIYIQNDAGVAETVTLVLDVMLPNDTANIDSLRVPVWTETTDGTDFVTISIFEDSLQTAFKAVADTTLATQRSAVARTATTKSITGINIVGGIVRFTFAVQTVSDSMFIGVPKAYVTNP